MRAAREARELTHAQLLCESLVAEITSGARMPSSTQGTIPEAPDWAFESILESTGQSGLVRLVVTVQKSTGTGRPISFTLSRFIRDPSLPIPVDPEPAADSSSSSSSSEQVSLPGGRDILEVMQRTVLGGIV